MLYYKRNSNVSEKASIYPFTIITNSSIEDYSYISYSCRINNTRIGKFCSIAQNVRMGLGLHPTKYLSTSPIFYSPKNPLREKVVDQILFEERKPITIENDIWIGANVTILDGVKIGNGAVIGAHSVVTKDVAPFSIVGGIPAKEIKKRFDDDVINKILDISWWEYDYKILKNKKIIELFSIEIKNIEVIEKISSLLKEC